jgi:hypothetical protein
MTRGTPPGKVGVPKRGFFQEPNTSFPPPPPPRPPSNATARSLSVPSEERLPSSTRTLPKRIDEESWPTTRPLLNNRKLVEEVEDVLDDVEEEAEDGVEEDAEAEEDVVDEVEEGAEDDPVAEAKEPLLGWKARFVDWKARAERGAIGALTIIQNVPTPVLRFVFLLLIAAAVAKALRGNRASVEPRADVLRCSLTSSRSNDPSQAFTCTAGAYECPPQGVCEAGVLTGCKPSSSWVLKASGTAARCVLTDAARDKVALVTSLLEAWSWPRTCVNDHPSPQQVHDAPATYKHSPVALFKYSTIQPFMALHGEHRPSQRLDTYMDESEFAIAAHGRLHLQIMNRERGAPFLVVGLLPNHTLPLPLSCRFGNFVVNVINVSTAALCGCIKWLAVSLLFNGLACPAFKFIKQTLLIIYSESPSSALGLALGGIAAIAVRLRHRQEARRRHKRMVLETDVEADCQRALDILSALGEPIRLSELSSELAANHEHKLRFEQGVWPQVLQRLELDERISFWMIEGEETVVWQG